MKLNCKFTFILYLFFTSTISLAQYVVEGKVFDFQTKESLPGALIIVDSGNVTTTDGNGAFILKLSERPESLLIRSLGYEDYVVSPLQNPKITVGLKAYSTDLQEVIVTANREASLRSEAPIAISKISQEVINDTKPVLLTEIISKVPGVVMQNLNNEQHGMSIRQPMGTSSYFLYMEDGLPLRPMGLFNHNGLIEMNLFAISNVEVVKGPVSSLYGPEAVGGAVNFITQKPTAVPTARIGFQANNYGYRRLQYGAGGMITKKFGIYAGGYYALQNNGWQTYSDFKKHSLNLRLDYTFTEKTKLYLTTSYHNYYSDMSGSVDSIAFYNRAYTGTSDFTYRQVYSLRTRLTLEHSWNNNNQTSVSGFFRDNLIGQNPSYSIRWISGSSTATGEINESVFKSYGLLAQHTKQFGFWDTRLTTGIYLDYSPTTYSAHQTELEAQLRPDLKSVEKYILLKERPDLKLADYSADLLNSAGYLQFVTSPVKKLKLTAGMRYDRMSFDYRNYLDQSSGSKLYDQLTGKIGATYVLVKNTGLYVNYSQGFSPPGLTSIFRKRPNVAIGDPNQFYYDLKPAKFDNAEIGGWAGLLNSMIYIDWAFYTMWGKNELLNIRMPDNSTDYASAGKTFHQGLEGAVSYRPCKAFTFRMGGSYSIHRFEEFLISNRPTDAFKDAGGKIMPSSPAWIGNSELTYKPQRYLKGLRASLEWQRISSWYQNQSNTSKYEDKTFLGLKGVSVLNFRMGYEYKGIEAFVNILNLTDELYAHAATRGNNATDRTTYTPAAPRSFVVGIQYNFTGKK
jgi:iron complex outermembrane receptor protein